jgi:hypothetical protein
LHFLDYVETCLAVAVNGEGNLVLNDDGCADASCGVVMKLVGHILEIWKEEEANAADVGDACVVVVEEVG